MTQQELMTELITKSIPHSPLLQLDGFSILLFQSRNDMFQVVLRDDQVDAIHRFVYQESWREDAAASKVNELVLQTVGQNQDSQAE